VGGQCGGGQAIVAGFAGLEHRPIASCQTQHQSVHLTAQGAGADIPGAALGSESGVTRGTKCGSLEKNVT